LGSGHKELQAHIIDDTRGIGVYALGAPNDCASSNMKIEHFNRIKKVVDGCNPSALVVYDIQDEQCKDGQPKPFKFIKKEQADIFANFISKQFPNNPIILYRALPEKSLKPEISEAERKTVIDTWMNDTITKRNQKTLVWIGGNSRKLPQIVGKTPADYINDEVKIKYPDVMSGSVCLPERGDIETDLMVKKTQNNCKFFITQMVYNYELFEKTIVDYVNKCISISIQPERIIFNFALFGEEKSINFMKCLGVLFSEEVLQKISEEVKEKNEGNYIRCSMNICQDLFKKLLILRKKINEEKHINLKIGFSVDVVTGNKSEYDKSIDLYKLLNQQMNELY
jgi:hypothetical protein